MRHWYVVRTRPHKESVAQINLNNQGFATFFPRIWKTYRRRGSLENKLCPLFPGYVFFQSTEDAALWRAVGGTVGVSYVLWGSGRRPTPVPQPFIKNLLSCCVDEVLTDKKNRVFLGDSVQITRGPLSGIVGTIISLEGSKRVELLLEIIGGAKAQVDLGDLERSN